MGWPLSDKSGHGYRFGNVRLNGHSQIRVYTGIGHDNRRDVCQDRRAYVWDNADDTATLRNEHPASSTPKAGDASRPSRPVR
ncbi:lamin tail domain-containing protein [Streptomyces decoyicus]|uniref:lamin tail domain-containing protein n=1 Tax=Streptomyces decoyicus TaxID=249567 RepID=UPI0037FEBCFA